MPEDASPLLEEATEAKPLPPLRIHHFFLWTIAVAVVMATSRILGHSDESFATSNTIYSLSALLPLTICLATFLLGIYWRIIGLPFFQEPGHWLLLALSLNLGYHLFSLILEVLDLANPRATYWIHHIIRWFLGGATIVVFVLVFQQSQLQSHWRRFFLFSAIIGSIEVALDVFYCSFGWQYLYVRFGYNLGYRWGYTIQQSVSNILMVATAILLFLAIRHDYSDSERRHWTHWCGALVWLGLSLGGVVWLPFGIQYIWNIEF